MTLGARDNGLGELFYSQSRMSHGFVIFISEMVFGGDSVPVVINLIHTAPVNGPFASDQPNMILGGNPVIDHNSFCTINQALVQSLASWLSPTLIHLFLASFLFKRGIPNYDPIKIVLP
jgi:hypothetical protein